MPNVICISAKIDYFFSPHKLTSMTTSTASTARTASSTRTDSSDFLKNLALAESNDNAKVNQKSEKMWSLMRVNWLMPYY